MPKLRLNLPDENGLTPLMHAVLAGDEERVGALLNQGALVNLRNQRGASALCAAAEKGRHEIVVQLLLAGADPNVRVIEPVWGPFAKATPCEGARITGHKEVVRVLSIAVQDQVRTSAASKAATNSGFWTKSHKKRGNAEVSDSNKCQKITSWFISSFTL